MSPEQIVRVTAAISMALAFLEPADPDVVAAQNVQERRICDFDRMIVACRFLLEVCGQTNTCAPSTSSGIMPVSHCIYCLLGG